MPETKPRPKAQSNTTTTVHYARVLRRKSDGHIFYTQACGMSRQQLCYLARVPDETPLTCKRCAS